MNPYSRLAQHMENFGAARNAPDMTLGIVVSTSPLQIKIGETQIGVNLYCNPALLLSKAPESVGTDETGLKQCLTELYQAFKLQVNDRVFVQQVRDPASQTESFFVIGKAVAL